jgi:hypothetical protein
MIAKLCLNTVMANASIAVILFLAFISDFGIILWCIPSAVFLSFVDVYLHFFIPLLMYTFTFSIPKYFQVFPCLNLCYSVFFFFKNSLCSLVKYNSHVDIITEGCICLLLFWELFLCFTYQLQIVRVK